MRTLNFIKSAVYCMIGKREYEGRPVTTRSWKGRGKKIKRQFRKELMDQTDKVVGWREECKAGVWL